MNHASQLATPPHIFGVDFSGAKEAGKHIWITAAKQDRNGLVVHQCIRADQLPDSSIQRDLCYAALRKFILQQGDAAFGLDFPFSIPEELIHEKAWLAFVRTFGNRFGSAEEFRAVCRQRSGGRELKRRCDRESRAPFSPYNLRLYRQTFYGIGEVLAPLVSSDSARVLPMQGFSSDKPWLLEVCPASLLKKEGLYSAYKGKEARFQQNRQRILDRFLESGEVIVKEQTIIKVLIGDTFGDALDSLLAAIITFRSLNRENFWELVRKSENGVEGVVFC